jgi:molybdopterin converting factor small subunit
MKASSFSTDRKESLVTVELIGTLRHHAGKRKLEIPIAGAMDVISFIQELEEKHGIPKGLLTESGEKGIRRSLLVLVNGSEIGVLDGSKTLLNPGDRLTLIPVSHGG